MELKMKMTRKTTLLGIILCLAVMAEDPTPLVKNIHGWNTWQRPDSGGKFERIAPSDELPQGAMKFLPDQDKDKYFIQWYKPFPVKPIDHLRFVFTFKSDEATNSDVAISLSLKARNQAKAWCKKPLASPQKATIEPGKVQELAIEVNLPEQDIPDIATLSPMITVTNLKTGSITFTGVKAELKEDGTDKP